MGPSAVSTLPSCGTAAIVPRAPPAGQQPRLVETGADSPAHGPASWPRIDADAPTRLLRPALSALFRGPVSTAWTITAVRAAQFGGADVDRPTPNQTALPASGSTAAGFGGVGRRPRHGHRRQIVRPSSSRQDPAAEFGGPKVWPAGGVGRYTFCHADSSAPSPSVSRRHCPPSR